MKKKMKDQKKKEKKTKYFILNKGMIWCENDHE